MTLSVTPETNLTEGGTATVCVEAGPPNTTVTVEVHDGDDPPQTDSIEIDLDENGEGCAEWTVPAWELAVFSYGDCVDLTRPIVPPDG